MPVIKGNPPSLFSARAALDRACDLALNKPYTARVMAHVALERAEVEGDDRTGIAALSLYTVLGGNFCGAGMA